MNRKVIEELWTMAEKAESGQIIAIAISTVLPDGSTGSSFVLGDALFSSLLGAVYLTAHRIKIAGDKGPLD